MHAIISRLRRAAALGALVLLAGVPPAIPAVPASAALAATCLTSSPSWQNGVIPTQKGKFAVSYDATPQNNNMDGVTGFSSAPATGYTDLALITRFNNSGFIDARNGGLYQAVSPSIPYSAGRTYHFRLEVDIPNHTYNVYVAPLGSSERTIGVGFAFRTEQATASSLGYENVFDGVHGIPPFRGTPAV